MCGYTEPVQEVRVVTPSKVNLALRVGALRPDGFHPLDTVFEALDLHDEVIVRGSDSLTLRIEGEGANVLPVDSANLAIRAAQALRDEADAPRLGAEMTIRKAIPVAGGMAGGSSDAAGALVALNALWGLGLSSADLQRIGSRLGSDVPFCLMGGIAHGTGRGEILTPVYPGGEHAWVLLTNPVGLSTPAVFREFDRLEPRRLADAASTGEPASTHELREAVTRGDLPAMASLMANDLQTAAFSLRPDLAEVVERADRLGATPILSGSGPTVALLASNAAQADRLALRAALEWPGLGVVRAGGPAAGTHVAEVK